MYNNTNPYRKAKKGTGKASGLSHSSGSDAQKSKADESACTGGACQVTWKPKRSAA